MLISILKYITSKPDPESNHAKSQMIRPSTKLQFSGASKKLRLEYVVRVSISIPIPIPIEKPSLPKITTSPKDMSKTHIC